MHKLVKKMKGRMSQVCICVHLYFKVRHEKCKQKFPKLGNTIVWEPNSESCLDLIFVAAPCEKVTLVSVETISHLQ